MPGTVYSQRVAFHCLALPDILLGPANNLSIRKSLIEKHNPPDIVLHGLVTAGDVEKLFEM